MLIVVDDNLTSSIVPFYFPSDSPFAITCAIYLDKKIANDGNSEQTVSNE